MKRLSVFFVSLLLIFLAGCESSDLKMDLITPRSYTPGYSTQIKVVVSDKNGNPVKGAKVKVVLNMPGFGMNHKDTTMDAKEIGEGVYVGDIYLSMEGDYVAKVKVEQYGKKYEQEKRFSIVAK